MNTRHSPRATWLDEAIGAVRKWYEAEGGGRDQKKRGDSKVGQALAVSARGPGWFTVTARDGRVDETDLEAAYLAPAGGSEQVRYNLRETVNEEGQLFVRVAPHAPAEGLYLWKQGRPAGQLVKTLLDGLEGLDGTGLVAAFGQRRPDPLPTPLNSAATTGLNEGQRAAFTACVSPGLHLIWGPPGTGKTEVITRALQHAHDLRRSVLLVSGTNVAVDNALERAVRRLQPEAGTMVRVGTPHLADIAANENVSLTALKRRSQQDKEAELHAIEERIAQAHQPIAEHREALEVIAGFDLDAYQAARDRINTSELAATLNHRYDSAVRAAGTAAQRLAQANSGAAEADRQWQGLAEAVQGWRRVDEINAEIKHCAARRDQALLAVHDAQNALAHAQTTLEELAGQGFLARLGSRRRRREAEAALAGAEQRLAEARNGFHQVDGAVTREIARLTAEKETLERANVNTPRSLVSQVWAHKQESEQRARAAFAEHRTAQAEAESLRARLERVLADPQATREDRELVERADRADLHGLLYRLGALEERADEARRVIAELEERRQKIERELAELGRDTERFFVGRASVVASTLAMMRMKPVIAQREYDYVIVDECAASSVPEVMYAVSRARVGAVLLGDFMQNSPIAPEKLRNNKDARVADWLAPRDCFSFFNVATPEQAVREPGCVVLTEQHRFGAELTRLANATAYGGLLRTASDRARTQVVFVDVDGLGESMSAVQQNPEGGGKWWSVGGVVSRAVAEQQLSTGAATSVGVVTPYRVQAELTQNIIDDAGGNPRIDVGTSHRFQGREFETVVFDMVEDGNGWVAGGALGGDPYRLSGLKLFNVAITRARHHLFLVGNGTGVERARSGPLAAVRDGIHRGEIEVVRVGDILGGHEPPLLEGAARDLWDAVSQYVKYTGLYDEGEVPGELVDRIAGARRSVWIWAPWVSRRVEDFLPALEDAQARGVDVRVVTLPRWELKNDAMERFHDELLKRVPRVVFMANQHQKLVVVDDQTTFIGSMNLLSHNRYAGRREIMTVVESATYAQHVLTFERVDQLALPPLCDRCGKRMRVIALTRPKTRPTLHWQCRTGGSRSEFCWEKPFPPRARTRNQRGPRR